MKIRKLVGGLILSTVLAAGVGIFAGSHNDFVKNAQAVETVDVYCTQTHDWANDEIIKIHQWGGSTPGTTWGWDTCTPMTYAFNNQYGQKVYKGTIPSDRTGFLGMYRQGTDLKESVNITTYSNNSGFAFTDDWPGGKNDVSTWTCYPYTINYYGNGSTSGSMSSSTAYGNVQWGLTSNAFVKTAYSFAGWATSSSGSVVYSDGGLLPTKTDTDTVNLYAQWSHSEGRYIVGKFGTCNWGIDGAIYMSPVNSQYEGQVELHYGDVFKIAYYDGSKLKEDSYFGYSWIREGCGAYHYFSGSGDSDITCVARGTYNFYFRDVEYEAGKKISIELQGNLNAEHLAAQLMGFGEYEGHCGDEDRFPAMKTIYLGLDGDEKTTFQGYASSGTAQFKNAYDRYTSWARALSENPWAEGKVSAANIIFKSVTENSGTTIIIAVISATCLAAIGGYFLFRRKKEN